MSKLILINHIVSQNLRQYVESINKTCVSGNTYFLVYFGIESYLSKVIQLIEDKDPLERERVIFSIFGDSDISKCASLNILINNILGLKLMRETNFSVIRDALLNQFNTLLNEYYQLHVCETSVGVQNLNDIIIRYPLVDIFDQNERAVLSDNQLVSTQQIEMLTVDNTRYHFFGLIGDKLDKVSEFKDKFLNSIQLNEVIIINVNMSAVYQHLLSTNLIPYSAVLSELKLNDCWLNLSDLEKHRYSTRLPDPNRKNPIILAPYFKFIKNHLSSVNIQSNINLFEIYLVSHDRKPEFINFLLSKISKFNDIILEDKGRTVKIIFPQKVRLDTLFDPKFPEFEQIIESTTLGENMYLTILHGFRLSPEKILNNTLPDEYELISDNNLGNYYIISNEKVNVNLQDYVENRNAVNLLKNLNGQQFFQIQVLPQTDNLSFPILTIAQWKNGVLQFTLPSLLDPLSSINSWKGKSFDVVCIFDKGTSFLLRGVIQSHDNFDLKYWQTNFFDKDQFNLIKRKSGLSETFEYYWQRNLYSYEIEEVRMIE